ncbi:hypothetical protein AVEN_166650-1 [Araneus ventricosus]|uniref:Uncharacterized protein n=1 Tax=Araneus ventricosus TaxID=182803 RepID=A0A4Y2E014_ARAVE|nr:hypothetical protein AVEN_166650-1 [Araneus ventricosus]
MVFSKIMTSHRNKRPSIPFYPSDTHKQTQPFPPPTGTQEGDGTFLQMSLFSSPNCIFGASKRSEPIKQQQQAKEVLESCPVPMDYQMMIPGCSDEWGGVRVHHHRTGQVQQILVKGYWFWKGTESWSPIRFQFGTFWISNNKYFAPVIRNKQREFELKKGGW